ncbi:sigma factor [Herbiconiux flava]|uniref:DNA-directed RNA polymerase specialized sigma24 family protein n=1 Tax=Herbiconiux flava TaxID=881268 RepID=A0A852STW1_9MICO|nr:sigma factor [Herbiconiux flava]NYD72192.1 DNA-directed RNA polymerase specialized sigma24 family protein [Herbiconiux flava]GLK17844.1 hypothetical protein GCM10017602_23260 [Herbiconiux flava]
MSQWSVTPDQAGLPSIPSLDGLLVRTASGDADAFADLYDRVAPRLLGFIRRFVADPQEAEDVAFEVFVDVWRRAARFDPRHGSALAWILQSAYGLAAGGETGAGAEIALSA